MQQKRKLRSLEPWRYVLAEVGLVESATEDQMKATADTAEKVSAARLAVVERRQLRKFPEVTLGQVPIEQMLGDGNKKVAKILGRALRLQELR